jgi:hypothetical protein
MSKTSNDSESGSAEPKALRAAVPVWLFVVLVLLFYWAMMYFDRNSGWFNAQVYAPYHSYAEVQDMQVRAIREEAIKAHRTQAYTAEELLQIHP